MSYSEKYYMQYQIFHIWLTELSRSKLISDEGACQGQICLNFMKVGYQGEKLVCL